MVKMIFRTQSPKVLVMEAHSLLTTRINVEWIDHAVTEFESFYRSRVHDHDTSGSASPNKQLAGEGYKGFWFRTGVRPYVTHRDYMKKTKRVTSVSPKNYNYGKY